MKLFEKIFHQKENKKFIDKFQEKSNNINQENFAKLDNDAIPYACLLKEDIGITKNGEVFKIIKIAIDDFRLNTEDGLREDIRNAILSNISDYKTSFWIQTIKKQCDISNTESRALKDQVFLQHMRKEYSRYSSKLNNYETFMYITILRHGFNFNINNQGGSIFSRFILTKKHSQFIDNEINILNGIVDKINYSLKLYTPKILSSVNRNGEIYSEIIEALSFIINFDKKEIKADEFDISYIINQGNYKFQDGNIVYKDDQNNKKFFSIFSLKEVPIISVNVVSKILSIPAEMIITEYVSYVDKIEAITEFKEQVRILKNSPNQNFQKLAGIDFLTKENSDNIYCKSSIAFAFISEDSMYAINNIQNIVGMLGKYGIIAVKEDISAQRTFFAMLPGNFSFVHRMSIHSVSEIGTFSYSYAGRSYNEEKYLGNFGLFKIGTLRNNPSIFGLLKNNQNILISGGDNTGKTTLTNFIAANIIDKYDEDFEINIIEFNSKSRTFIEAINGQWYQVSLDKKHCTAKFNAMNNNFIIDIKTAENHLINFFSLLLASSNIIISPEIISEIRNLINKLNEFKKKSDNIALHDLIDEIDVMIIDREIQAWHSMGKYYHLFDNRNDILNHKGHKCIYLDETICQSSNILANIMNHIIMNIIHRSTKKARKILILEEPFFLLSNPFFKSKLNNILKIADQNGVILILKIKDISLDSKTMVDFRALLNQCKTQIHFGNTKVDDNYGKMFSIDKYVYMAIKTIGVYERGLLIKDDDNVVSYNFELNEQTKTLNILSDNPDIRRRVMNIREGIQTDDPGRWVPAFYMGYSALDEISAQEVIAREMEDQKEIRKIIES